MSKMKKFSIVVGAIVVMFLGLLVILNMRDRDCETAVSVVQERVGTFAQRVDDVGDCDGVCVDWSIFGCTVSDDFNSWHVSPWGFVSGPTKALMKFDDIDWQLVTVGSVVTFEIPSFCHFDPGAGTSYVICPTTENPEPLPEMSFSSDGITVNVRRWEGLDSQYWQHVIGSLSIIQPMTHDITINIES